MQAEKPRNKLHRNHNQNPVSAAIVFPQPTSRWQNSRVGIPFTCCPVSPQSRFDAQVFRVFSCGASGAHCKLPVWPSTRLAWPSLCSLSLGWGFAPQRVLLGECGRSDVPRAGAGVSLNVRVHDLLDNRRIEIIADGLPLFHGAQLAVDTTMVSALHADGNPRRQSDVLDGAILTRKRANLPRTDRRAWQSAPCRAGV